VTPGDEVALSGSRVSATDGSRPTCRLRIAFVLGQLSAGGTETQAQLLVRGLIRRGATVDVFIVEGGVADGDFGDARVVELSIGRKNGAAGAVVLALAGWRLARALRDGDYDVVHAALARAYVLAPLAAPLRRRPPVVAWRRNLGYHLTRCSPAAFLEALAGRLTSVVICNSNAVADHWTHRAHVRKGAARVVQNGIESWRFEPTEEPMSEPNLPRLVTVGGLRSIKGHQVLLEAAATLRSNGALVEVVIAGDGPDRGKLEQRARQLRVPLAMPGHICDTRGLLGSSTIYVHPSYSEGSSNAIAEAMAYGCAILATDVGDAAEMLGDAGRLVRPGDATAMAVMLSELLTDGDARLALGAAAQERARSRFSLDSVLDQHLAIYYAAA